MTKIVLFDTETTSTSNDKNNEMIEIAWKEYQPSDPSALYVTPRTLRMKPDSPCSPAAIVVHGMNQAAVDAFEPAKDAMPKLAVDFDRYETEGAFFASYNIPFDIPMVVNAYQKYLARELKPSRTIDVLRLAQKTLDPKKLGNLKLDTVYYYLLRDDIGEKALDMLKDMRAVHGAGIDVTLTEQAFNKLWKLAEAKTGTPLTTEGMSEFLKLPMMIEEWPWGKHRGDKICDVLKTDYSYVEWFLYRCDHRDTHPDLVYSLKESMKRKSP